MGNADKEVKKEVHVTLAVMAVFPDRRDFAVKFFRAARTPKSNDQLPHGLLVVIREKLNHLPAALPALGTFGFFNPKTFLHLKESLATIRLWAPDNAKISLLL